MCGLRIIKDKNLCENHDFCRKPVTEKNLLFFQGDILALYKDLFWAF